MVVHIEDRVAAVRFNAVGKIYHFDAQTYPELRPADFVVVETARGRQLGQIIKFIPRQEAISSNIKRISRPATARDLMMRKLWEAKEAEALVICREQGQNLTKKYGVKFIKARYNYDGSMLAVLYTSEEANIDTTKFHRNLEREFNTRIEVRRIGSRDAAKLIGEYGACGAPRCCTTHLTEFSPISIRMAKAQGISLNPSEITGMCGRLRCCLIYEYEQYLEANKELPRRGKWIGTPFGEAKVVEVNSLKDSVTVYVEGTRHEVQKEDIIPLQELRALQEKAKQGCSREGEAGPCECGARVRSGQAPQKADEKSGEPSSSKSRKTRRRPSSKKKRRSGRPRRQRRQSDHKGKRDSN